MPAVFEYPIRVDSFHLDPNRHVNNVVYVQWMQDAALAHSAAQGWSTKRYRELGVTWVSKTHVIEYHQQAFEGDEIILTTWIADMLKISSTRRYMVKRVSDGALLLTASTNWIMIDITKNRPVRIPLEIQQSFQVVDHPPAA
ncbi:acyl-CoA thioesterase [Lacunimicrobium album]